MFLSSQYGHTPLHVASGSGHIAVVQELLAKNANKEAKNKVRYMHMMEMFKCLHDDDDDDDDDDSYVC